MVVGLIGCSQISQPTESIPEATPDPCAPQQIHHTIKPVHRLVRKFADTTDLAFSTPVEQLAPQLAQLEVLRDDVSTLEVLDCAVGLKTDAGQYMDATLELFLLFIEDPYSEDINYKMEVMDLHWENYLETLSSTLGVVLTPSPTPVIIIVEEAPQDEVQQEESVETEAPAVTQTPVSTDTPTEIIPQIVVQAADGVTVRSGPGADFAFLAVLPQGSIAPATGRNVEEAWVQISFDDAADGVGWVFATQVELNFPIADLPIVNTP